MTTSVAVSGRLAVALAALAVLAGCSAPVGTADTSLDDGSDGDTSVPVPTPGDRSTENRSAPDSDVQGWENGYWYDDTLSIDASDGLDEDERAAVVARAMARVEHVRDVEFDESVPVEVQRRSELGGGGGGSDGGDGDASDAATVESIRLRALFLVGDDAGDEGGDPEGDTRQATVQGYYDPAEERVVIVTDDETAILDEATLAHELYHAHQFENRPLRIRSDYTDDNLLGFRALIEGDANVVERRYERQCEAAWDCVGVRGDGGGAGDGDGAATSGFDLGLYLLSYVPYAEGEPLVAAAYEEGGWDAVDALYRDPPDSSEQVIHYEARGDDAPERVTVPDRSTDDWRRVTRTERPDAVTVGEAGLATMFLATAFDDRPGGLVDREAVLNRRDDGSIDGSDPIDYAVNYSTRWAGDGLATYERSDGEPGYVWQVRFDDAAAADEFARGYRRLLAYYGGTDRDDHWNLSGSFAGAYRVAVDGRTATVVHAPSANALGDLWPAANVSTVAASSRTTKPAASLPTARE
jgi:hypothetical protein